MICKANKISTKQIYDYLSECKQENYDFLNRNLVEEANLDCKGEAKVKREYLRNLNSICDATSSDIMPFYDVLNKVNTYRLRDNKFFETGYEPNNRLDNKLSFSGNAELLIPNFRRLTTRDTQIAQNEFKKPHPQGSALNCLFFLNIFSRRKATILLSNLEQNVYEEGGTKETTTEELLSYIETVIPYKITIVQLNFEEENSIIKNLINSDTIENLRCYLLRINKGDLSYTGILYKNDSNEIRFFDPLVNIIQEFDDQFILLWKNNGYQSMSILRVEEVSIEKRAESKEEQLFKKTYNAKYLKNLSREELDEISEHSNFAQKKLIFNLKLNLGRPNFIRYDSIVGPFGLDIYSLVDKDGIERVYHFFSEYHNSMYPVDASSDIPCKNIIMNPPQKKSRFADYIVDLAHKTPAFFDLYFEFDITNINQEFYRFNFSTALYRFSEETKDYDSLSFSNFLQAKDNFLINGLINISYPTNLNEEIEYIFNKVGSRCFSGLKSQLDPLCKNFRVHYNNIRMIIDKRFILILPWLLFCSKLNYGSHIETIKANTKVKYQILLYCGYETIVEFLTQYETTPEKVVELMINIDQKIKKEFKTSEYHREIKEFYMFKVYNSLFEKYLGGRNISLHLKTILEKVQNYLNGQLDSVLNDYENKFLDDFFEFITFMQMDFYQLLRMFKKFKISDSHIEQQPEYSNVNIIYTGASHIINYKMFFGFLKLKGYQVKKLYEKDDYEIVSEGEKIPRCLTIDRDYIRQDIDILI